MDRPASELPQVTGTPAPPASTTTCLIRLVRELVSLKYRYTNGGSCTDIVRPSSVLSPPVESPELLPPPEGIHHCAEQLRRTGTIIDLDALFSLDGYAKTPGMKVHTSASETTVGTAMRARLDAHPQTPTQSFLLPFVGNGFSTVRIPSPPNLGSDHVQGT